MNDVPQQPLPETMLPVSQADLEKAGFPTSAPMAPGLAVFFNDAMFNRCKVLAGVMSRGEGAVPKHLIGKPETCFAIMSRAITWNLDPYSVAEGTYSTPSGQIGYKGVLIQAILENSGKLDGGVKFEHVGDWSKVKGKFKIVESQKATGGKYPVPTWTREEAFGLKVIVRAKVRGESEPRELEFDLDSAFPLNSPLWATNPKQQICYTAVRAFANLAMPGVLLGIPFDVDPTSFYGEPMTNVTPPRPTKAGGEFDRPQETAKAETPKANGKAKPEPEPEKVAETVAAKDEIKAEVVHADPPKAETVSNETAKSNTPQQQEREPGDDTEMTAAQEHAQWYRDQVAEVAKSATIKDLIELRDEVVQNVTDEAQAIEFRKLCGTRAGTILNGEVAEAKYVKDVTDLRGKYSAVLGADTGAWFNKLCDDRQRVILAATRKNKQ